MIFHWFLHLTGSDNTSGVWYGFWSGFGSDLMEFTALGMLWRKLNCHVDGCHRIGLHHVDGTPYVTCRKHHPSVEDKITGERIAYAHHKYMKDK